MRNRDAFGFTLVELVVVFSVMAILGTAGIAAFVSYSRTQALDAASSEVLSMLQTAKSRAQSQVRPSGVCLTATLDGYKVTIAPPDTYKLELKCGAIVQPIEERRLPQNVTFEGGLPQVFLFRILTGGVEGTGTVTLTAYGKSKYVSVTQSGLARVQPDTCATVPTLATTGFLSCKGIPLTTFGAIDAIIYIRCPLEGSKMKSVLTACGSASDVSAGCWSEATKYSTTQSGPLNKDGAILDTHCDVGSPTTVRLSTAL